MSKNLIIVCAAVLASTAVVRPAQAHFILLKPDSWVNEDQSAVGGGAPQKGGPCGPGGYDDVQPVPMSQKVTTVHVGDVVHVQWQTTIPHDGYFRISLDPKHEPSAATMADFPDPHFADATACSFDSMSEQTGAHDNVLMDGIDPNSSMQDVTIPNKPCDKCTLQVIMVMKDHGPPNCIYYHCANLQILAADGSAGTGSGGMGTGGANAGSGGKGTGGAGAGSGGTTVMMGSGGMGGMGTAGTSPGTGAVGGTHSTGSGGASSVPSGGGGSAGQSTMQPGSGGAAPIGGGTAGSGMVVGSAPSSKSSSGCAVSAVGADGRYATWFALALGVATWQRRRARRR
jgi:hypothetical protein